MDSEGGTAIAETMNRFLSLGDLSSCAVRSWNSSGFGAGESEVIQVLRVFGTTIAFDIRRPCGLLRAVYPPIAEVPARQQTDGFDRLHERIDEVDVAFGD